MKKVRIGISFIPAILWMGLIFWFSGQDGSLSGAESSFVLEKVLYYMEEYAATLFYYLKEHVYLIGYASAFVILSLFILMVYSICKSKSIVLKIIAVLFCISCLYFFWGYRNDYTQLLLFPKSALNYGYRTFDYIIDYLRSATISTLELLIRKAAHISLFFGLYILLFFGFLVGAKKEEYAVPYTISILYAMSDELHQYFVDGRGAALSDVAIDSLGVTTALFLCIFLVFVFKTLRRMYLDLKEKLVKK